MYNDNSCSMILCKRNHGNAVLLALMKILLFPWKELIITIIEMPIFVIIWINHHPERATETNRDFWNLLEILNRNYRVYQERPIKKPIKIANWRKIVRFLLIIWTIFPQTKPSEPRITNYKVLTWIGLFLISEKPARISLNNSKCQPKDLLKNA